jgi:diaminohydroxyphosphoribosylaminopyrimidine deaminase/5-amino-6-(5-phosphoribosylamino)uracil reductase
LQIAKKGLGTARPNPSVGAVVVYQNKIIGEGYTSPYGGSHAEVNAINSVEDKALLAKATMYVTLEPCSHFGKTPPCADLLVKHQFKNVVIGCLDTNTLVAGKGIERLKKAGINVLVGVLEAACFEHHKRFFTVQNKKRPYIILKWAETKEGYIAPKSKEEQKPIWISNGYSQQLVHKWRSEEHAILVGTNTVIADNPKLNVRSWSGQSPVRIVLDRNLRISSDAYVFDGTVKTIVITSCIKNTQKLGGNIILEEIDFSKNLGNEICTILQKHKIQSVILEGGAITLQTFIDEDLWDETRVFTGDITLGSGVRSPKFSASVSTEMKIKNDVLKIYRND